MWHFKKVEEVYSILIKNFGNEYNVLLNVLFDKLKMASEPTAKVEPTTVTTKKLT